MIGDNPAWDTFISEHRWAVLTTLRRDGHPVSSVIAYARDGDELVISTPGATFKAASISRDERVTLCIISNAEPFNYVNVEASARVTTDRLVDDTRLVFANISDTGYQEPEDLQAWLTAQRRVILRLKPERVFGVIR